MQRIDELEAINSDNEFEIYTRKVEDQTSVLDTLSSCATFTPSNNNSMVNQLKSKLQIEREKHKKVTDKMKQNFDSILASTKQSFSEEIEKLQSMLADSSNQCSNLSEKLEIAEEIMDDNYTN